MSVTDLSRSDRLRHWLMYGSAAPATMACAHGHQWTGRSRSATLLRPVHRRWFWLPVGLFRMVYDNRSMEPVPITYVMATVVGGVLGAALDFVLGWPWWLTAVGFVAVVWLFFFASAFWGQDPIRSDKVRDVIDPSGIEAREFARLEEAISTGQLVGMEAAGWTGSRSLGGWGGSSHPDHVTLRHGNPELDEAWVSVTTRRSERDVGRLEWRKDDLFRELLHSEEQPPEGLNVDERHRWLWKQERRIEETKPGEWSTTAMTIDGTVTRSDVIQRGDRWVAIAVIDGATIEVMARGLAVNTVALNRTPNLRPYIDGTGELRAAHRREHGH